MNESAYIFLDSPPLDFNCKTEWTGLTFDIHGLLSGINAYQRAARTRRVSVRLFSYLTSNKPKEIMFYKSLDAIQSQAMHGGGIEVSNYKFSPLITYKRKLHLRVLNTINT